ncbi:MAG: hypothetical protein N2645_23515 [Clostridia bacterium]|nr:hypothetical protein [Clostridia bacterium]
MNLLLKNKIKLIIISILFLSLPVSFLILLCFTEYMIGRTEIELSILFTLFFILALIPILQENHREKHRLYMQQEIHSDEMAGQYVFFEEITYMGGHPYFERLGRGYVYLFQNKVYLTNRSWRNPYKCVLDNCNVVSVTFSTKTDVKSISHYEFKSYINTKNTYFVTLEYNIENRIFMIVLSLDGKNAEAKAYNLYNKLNQLILAASSVHSMQ